MDETLIQPNVLPMDRPFKVKDLKDKEAVDARRVENIYQSVGTNGNKWE